MSPTTTQVADAGHDQDDDDEGDMLMAPHPYGIRPRGNLLAAGGKNALSSSLGRLRQLDDACLLAVLSKLTPKSLCLCSAASVGCYAFCHADGLWRDLTLALRGASRQHPHVHHVRLGPSSTTHTITRRAMRGVRS